MSELIRKLGIREGARLYVYKAPEAVLEEMKRLNDLHWVGSGEQADYIHIFVFELDELLSLLDGCVEYLANNGMLWVSWPKKASGVNTNLNREVVREILLETGLVDTKVCAVDDTWSGLKFVRRLKDRK
jgi:hypothetical protein